MKLKHKKILTISKKFKTMKRYILILSALLAFSCSDELGEAPLDCDCGLIINMSRTGDDLKICPSSITQGMINDNISWTIDYEYEGETITLVLFYEPDNPNVIFDRIIFSDGYWDNAISNNNNLNNYVIVSDNISLYNGNYPQGDRGFILNIRDNDTSEIERIVELDFCVDTTNGII